ncbi:MULTISPECIES: hypothetical protein [Bacillus cereus group]|uniref:hypothetical protein n=1 Tax=Bacillus cereus group TaxID=86661 RepID=UPI0008FD9ED2|nr:MULTISPECIES: hypothetical protein [Bacillus cereus group]MDA2038003.1 hypothetical protein [Bacillus cereus]MCM0004815.1 hypothetical protein [Bacillus paranthracis]MCU5175717.1 hypothetical protein [Bacillus paranthracis]MDA1919221.1 hypothetical protein [Bacillus cereus group sp. BcHK140]MDA1957207.1 hypothetical protein [Bacillus cereus group sp. BcHK114]
MKEKTCNQCGISLTKSLLKSVGGSVGILNKPSQHAVVNATYSEVIPYVCSKCGEVRFFINDPEKYKE